MIKKLLKLLNNLCSKQAEIVPIVSKHKSEVNNVSIKNPERLEGIHPDLVRLAEEVSRHIPLVIPKYGGVRTIEIQKILVKSKLSKTINSKHLKGNALDIMPYYKKKVDWKNKIDLAYFCGYVKATADRLGIKIRQGCKWDKETIKENKFPDFAHQELIS